MMAEVIEKTIEWCRGCFNISSDYIINYKRRHMDDCWAECERINDIAFEITIHPTMCIRDTVATVIHEMLHVKQWIHESKRDEEDDGEAEANSLQYKLADLMWSLGIL